MARRDASGAERPGLDELDSTTVSGGGVGNFVNQNLVFWGGSRAWGAQLIGATLVTQQAFGTMTTPGTDPTAYSVFFRMYVEPTHGGSGNPSITVFRLRHGAADGNAEVRLTWTNGSATASLQVRVSDGVNTSFTSTERIPTGKWVPIHIRVTVNTGVGQTDPLNVRINGAAEIQPSPARNFATAGLSAIDFGIIAQNDVGAIAPDPIVYFDDIVLDDVDAANRIPDTTFLARLRATGVVSSNWAGGAGGSSIGDDDDNTFRGTVNDGQVHTGSFEDLGGTLPSVAAVGGVYFSLRSDKNSDPLSLPGDILLRLDTSTESDGSATHTVPNSTTPSTFRSVIVSSLIGGSAWTIAKVNDLRIRMEADLDVNEGVRVREAWAYVDLSVPVALTDTVTLTESPSIKVTVPLAEPVTLSESPSIKATFSLTDSFTISEALALLAKLSLADAFALAETLAITAKVSLTDTIAITEAVSVFAKVDLSDSFTLSEAVSILVKFTLDDTFTLSEVAASLNYVPQGQGGGTSFIVMVNE